MQARYKLNIFFTIWWSWNKSQFVDNLDIGCKCAREQSFHVISNLMFVTFFKVVTEIRNLPDIWTPPNNFKKCQYLVEEHVFLNTRRGCMAIAIAATRAVAIAVAK